MGLVPFRKREGWLDPFSELERLQDEMNRLFDFSLSRWPERTGFFRRTWRPAVDIKEEDDRIEVKADLPGVKKDEVDVSIEDDTLIIKGEKKEESEEEKKGFRRKERFYGSFHREIDLPSTVDKDKVKASYKDGVLELTLPKKEEAKKKQIKVDIE